MNKNTVSTGHEFEKRILGRSSGRHPLDVSYEPYEAAYMQARQGQPAGWHPRNPASAPMQRLLVHLRELLRAGRGSQTVKALPKLGLFTTTDTPLDYWHGADAFVEWSERSLQTGNFLTVHVTLDLTVNPHKRANARLINAGQKADFVLSQQDLQPEALAAKSRLMMRLLVDRRQMLVNPVDWPARIRSNFAAFNLSQADADAYLGRVSKSRPIWLDALS